jgi:glycosyltransferase involved in cell wall biosynthesis
MVQVEIVVPVHNEAAALEASIRRLHRYLDERFPISWCVTIADNASTDATWAIATRLAAELDGVRAHHLDEKGRGRALRAAWSASDADVVTYMDVDLSTDLDGLLPLVAPLLSGHSDLAIGSRLAHGARVTRGPKRETISRAYNLLLRTVLRSRFSDAQCGFKAVRTDVARSLLPLVEDQGWFFDTELLVLAERKGLRIHEVPVDWVDDPDSRVDIVATALTDLAGVVRMLRARVPKFVRYTGVSVIATLVSLVVLGVLVRTDLATPGWANVIATLVGTVPSFELNRRWVWRQRGRPLVAEAGPFVALSLAGLALSTLTVHLAGAWATSIGYGPGGRAVVAEAAHLAAFGSLWLLQFALLDRVLFVERVDSQPAPSPLPAERPKVAA